MKHPPWSRYVVAAILSIVVVQPAFAAGSGGPDFVWNKILQDLAENFVGVVAFAVGALLIVTAGFHFASGDSHSAGRRLIQAIVAVAIGVGANILVDQIATSVGALI